MKAILCALVAAFTACAVEEEALEYPPVESRYSIGETVDCRGTVDEAWSPEVGPATQYTCTWERVSLGGEPACAVVLVFERADASSPWALSASFATGATRCT